MKDRVAIVSGVRSPFCKAGGVFKDTSVEDLGAAVVSELIARAPFDADQIDEVIIGNVIQPPTSTNIARVIAGKAGLPEKIPAYTVGRNCASGMEAVASAANKILLGQDDIILAGGVESMSNFPILYPAQMRDFLMKMNRSKTLWDKIRNLFYFRPSMLVPQVPGLDDPLCGLSMGQTAEKIIREFKVSRLEQDQFALESQSRAARATKSGRFQEEIVPVPLLPDFKTFQSVDDGIRYDQTIEALQKLKPVFDSYNGSVTAGNSSQLTDGAAMLFVMSERKAKELGLKPLGYLLDHAEVGLDPSKMGLGPVYATAKLLKRTGMTLDQIDLIEINEAFAGQVLAVMKAFASDDFAKKHLGRDKAIGTIDHKKLNVNGGAVALGHPLGASGARLILTLLLELKKQGKRFGLATLCVGGGQGQACLLEVN
jgi:acetyl-CoA acyltransferase